MSGARHECVAGIQARTSSVRLPGKVLADVGGKPLIQRVYERTRAATLLDEVVVLTSTEASDDDLCALLARNGIPFRRGPLADVRARYVALADELEPRYVVRVTADCPFVEPSFVDLQLGALRGCDADLVRISDGGALEGTLGGQGAFSTRALRRSLASEDPRDREHVSSFYFCAHADELRTVELEVDAVYRRPGLRLAVDEPADLELARLLYAAADSAGDGLFPLERALRWLDACPELLATNGRVRESADNRALRRLARAAEEERVTRSRARRR